MARQQGVSEKQVQCLTSVAIELAPIVEEGLQEWQQLHQLLPSVAGASAAAAAAAATAAVQAALSGDAPVRSGVQQHPARLLMMYLLGPFPKLFVYTELRLQQYEQMMAIVEQLPAAAQPVAAQRWYAQLSHMIALADLTRLLGHAHILARALVLHTLPRQQPLAGEQPTVPVELLPRHAEEQKVATTTLHDLFARIADCCPERWDSLVPGASQSRQKERDCSAHKSPPGAAVGSSGDSQTAVSARRPPRRSRTHVTSRLHARAASAWLSGALRMPAGTPWLGVSALLQPVVWRRVAHGVQCLPFAQRAQLRGVLLQLLARKAVLLAVPHNRDFYWSLCAAGVTPGQAGTAVRHPSARERVCRGLQRMMAAGAAAAASPSGSTAMADQRPATGHGTVNSSASSAPDDSSPSDEPSPTHWDEASADVDEAYEDVDLLDLLRQMNGEV